MKFTEVLDKYFFKGLIVWLVWGCIDNFRHIRAIKNDWILVSPPAWLMFILIQFIVLVGGALVENLVERDKE